MVPGVKQQESKRFLFLTLNLFSGVGGIENVCKCVGMALWEYYNAQLFIFSMHDDGLKHDARYFPKHVYRAFKTNRLAFAYNSIFRGMRSSTVLISHVNLLLFAYIIKRVSPRTQVLLLAHGIEVWQPLKKYQQHWMNCCDKIICVSSYTLNKLCDVNGINKANCVVVNNCLDPFIHLHASEKEYFSLKARYNLAKSDFLLLTLSRLTGRDRAKGYEKVLKAVSELQYQYTGLKYMIAGTYNVEEKVWLDELVAEYQISDRIIFTGYVDEKEMAGHFAIANAYVMPSKKEGFGNIFIEAMYHGLPVIAGNADGSVDALLQGQLGLLVNPDSQVEITNAIKKLIDNTAAYKQDQVIINNNFGYNRYKREWFDILNNLS